MLQAARVGFAHNAEAPVRVDSEAGAFLTDPRSVD